MNENETFILDTDTGSEECRIITTMFSETRKKYYVIYEYVENPSDIFVSSYDPTDEEGILEDVTAEDELKEITEFLEEYGVFQDEI